MVIEIDCLVYIVLFHFIITILLFDSERDHERNWFVGLYGFLWLHHCNLLVCSRKMRIKIDLLALSLFLWFDHWILLLVPQKDDDRNWLFGLYRFLWLHRWILIVCSRERSVQKLIRLLISLFLSFYHWTLIVGSSKRWGDKLICWFYLFFSEFIIAILLFDPKRDQDRIDLCVF
jgi:hypothetical protein